MQTSKMILIALFALLASASTVAAQDYNAWAGTYVPEAGAKADGDYWTFAVEANKLYARFHEGIPPTGPITEGPMTLRPQADGFFKLFMFNGRDTDYMGRFYMSGGVKMFEMKVINILTDEARITRYKLWHGK